ncbi:hypothetical protein SeMB42_g00789 [Synchytrium endobioticum]|uniref:Radial spoke head 1 n=1 Tax=Synchytrium endobioticum TaxID=286115 RepID=A0A507DP99_9FUNG|nr:hypothetical protein SeMB42_g00789 [Synchytrium endobioticum]
MSDDGQSEHEEGPSIGTYEGGRNAAGQRHGSGRMLWPNGDSYEGEYADGVRCGKGTYRWKTSGARYAGNYVDDRKHGEGLLVYPDASKYKGSFVAGKRSGYGTYLYMNGDVYKGMWDDDAKHGQGEYTYGSTSSVKRGTWVQNTLSGQGEVVHADHTIKGTWASNEHMTAPVKVTYVSSGYSQLSSNPLFLGTAPEFNSEIPA